MNTAENTPEGIAEVMKELDCPGLRYQQVHRQRMANDPEYREAFERTDREIQARREAKKQKEEVPFTQTEAFRSAYQRLVEVAKSRAESEPEPISPLERDRTLLHYFGHNDEGFFRDCSLHSPSFKRTAVVDFLSQNFPGQEPEKRAAMIIGEQGTGKTFGTLAFFLSKISASIDNKGNIRWLNGRYIKAYDLAMAFADSKAEHHAKILQSVRRCDWLLIDDLGTEPGGYKGSEFVAHFDNLFDLRYRSYKYTFITSNGILRPKEGQATLKEIYGERVFSRLAQIGYVFETKDPDFRRVKGG